MFGNIVRNMNNRQRVVVFALLSMFVVVVIVAVTSVIIKKPVNEVEITNIDDYIPKAPSDYKTDLQKGLWQVLSERFEIPEGRVDEYDVVIRDGSYSETVKKTTTTAKFLVDIDALKQTFAITFTWPSNGRVNVMERFVIDCPKREEMKYPDSFCDGQYNNSTDIDLYLPYTKYDNNGNPLYQISYYDGWIMVSLQTCGDEKLTAQYRAEVDAWLKDTKIDLEKYKDKTRYKTTCDHNF